MDEQARSKWLKVASVLMAVGALLIIFVGFVVLSIGEEVINVPLYPPRDMDRYLAQQVWIEYPDSQSIQESSSKPWHYRSKYSLQLTQGEWPTFVHVHRPFWYEGVKAEFHYEQNSATTVWVGSVPVGLVLIIFSVLDILFVIRIWPTRKTRG